MERVHGTCKASNHVPEDFISSMPDIVMSNILDRLPMQDAVRTGILSKEWRFKWTLLTQLVFGWKFYNYLVTTKSEKCYGRIISRLLCHLKGPITKLYLIICQGCYSKLDVNDLNNWIITVSTKGIEDFTLFIQSRTPYELPTQLFSCPKLKHLMLYNCYFRPMSGFHGFPNLLSLDLRSVTFESYQCGELITQCPLLETIRFTSNTTNKVKDVEIAKHGNLKVLTLELCELENMETVPSSTIYKLVGLFPKLQELELHFENCKLLTDSQKRVPTSLLCLKALALYDIDFSSNIMVSCAIKLICGSPNLETLRILGTSENAVAPPEINTTEVDCSQIGQLQLREVVFGSISGLENELCLIKSLMASSPLLKKMGIVICMSKEVLGGELMLAKKLLKLHRASPIAEIDLY